MSVHGNRKESVDAFLDGRNHEKYHYFCYYDNHAAASAHGHQTWEAYIADDNGSQEVTVTSTSTKKILYVTLTNLRNDSQTDTGYRSEPV